jgi:hypothetical protein
VGTKLERSKCSPSGISVMEIWITVFVQREQSYRDLVQSLRPAGTKLQRSGSKSLSSGNKVTQVWIKVFVQREHSYRDQNFCNRDLDQNLHPAELRLQRSKCLHSRISAIETYIKIFIQREQSYGNWNFGYRDLDQNLRLAEFNGESLTHVEDPDPN